MGSAQSVHGPDVAGGPDSVPSGHMERMGAAQPDPALLGEGGVSHPHPALWEEGGVVWL